MNDPATTEAAFGNAQSPRSLARTTVVIVSNGFVDGPAQALRDYLVVHKAAHVTVILHPLLADEAGRHEITEWRAGELVRRRSFRLPSRPPLTFPLDLAVPIVPPRADYWFGFNCLAASVGLAARRTGRVDKVVYWCVDYVDDRFGATPLTRAYETLDGLCCRSCDARFELSAEALAARTRRHDHSRRAGRLAPATVVPMGAWTDRTPTTASDAYERRKVVFMGHLVPMQGVSTLLDAVAILNRRFAVTDASIIGRGLELEPLKQRAAARGLDAIVTFHGFVEAHAEVERMLATGSVAVAPYDTTIDSFKRFADPGKLKAYLAAGLPIVTTPVAHNARELEQQGCARVVDFTAEDIASAIQDILDHPDMWRSMREASLRVARSFDWNRIIGEALESVGIERAG